MRPETMAAAFVSCKTAFDNCIKNSNTEWAERWRKRLNMLVNLIPSGSGIDSGPRTRDDVDATPNAIRFDIAFHHMNDGGYYDGWTEHTVDIRPAFTDINVRISGRDRNQVKDYIHEVMSHAFTRHVTWDEPTQRWIMESDDDHHAAMERAYPTRDPLKHACANPECPKRRDGAAEHQDDDNTK